ncbi:MAG: hypothetical protein CMP43_01560 [Rickettsiales bacterium]|nr:hypothetical protein [Rickettsiales bacterium]
MSFEVKSGERYDDLDMKDCLNYLDKGKVLHKIEDNYSVGTKGDKEQYLRVQTIFSYKQKTYVHSLLFTKQYSFELENSFCEVWDFDIPKEKN